MTEDKMDLKNQYNFNQQRNHSLNQQRSYPIYLKDNSLSNRESFKLVKILDGRLSLIIYYWGTDGEASIEYNNNGFTVSRCLEEYDTITAEEFQEKFIKVMQCLTKKAEIKEEENG